MEETKWIRIHEDRAEEHLALLWLSSENYILCSTYIFPTTRDNPPISIMLSS